MKKKKRNKKPEKRKNQVSFTYFTKLTLLLIAVALLFAGISFGMFVSEKSSFDDEKFLAELFDSTEKLSDKLVNI